MGIKTLDGAPLFFRESQYAARNFKLKGGVYTGNAIIPRPKFLFFVKFGLSKSAINSNLSGFRDTTAYSNIKDGLIFQIKQIDKPKFNIKTETMHQYNKKRVIQTGIEYNPMTINFHDDVGDKVLRFWSDYYEYYYGDGGREKTSDWQYDIVTTDFFNGATSNGWGYKGNFLGGSQNMHFLDHIELFQFYGGRVTSSIFVRPLITIFDHDNNDYAEGREGTGIRISFDYEGVIYNLKNKLIDDSNKDEFGFVNDYFDPRSTIDGRSATAG